MNPRCCLCVGDAVGVCLECDQPVCGIHEALAEHDCASACGTWRERIDNITRQRDEARAERDAIQQVPRRVLDLEQWLAESKTGLIEIQLLATAAKAELDEARTRLTRVREMLTGWLDPRFSADGATKVTTVAVRALLNVLAGTR